MSHKLSSAKNLFVGAFKEVDKKFEPAVKLVLALSIFTILLIIFPSLKDSVIAMGVLSLVEGIASIFVTISLFYLFGKDEIHPLGGYLKVSSKKFWSYLWVSIIGILVFIGGFVMLVIPALIFAVWFAFSQHALLLEGKHGWEAFKRSRELVKGHFWAVVLRYVFIALVCGAFLIPFMLLDAIVPKGRECFAALASLALMPLGVAYSIRLFRELVALKSHPEPAKEAA